MIHAGANLTGIICLLGAVVIAFLPTELPADWSFRGWLQHRSQSESNSPISWYYSPLPYVVIIAIGVMVYASAK